MREVNFSLPNGNKASVGITNALYDRRALDCTSTLPLISSLNHLSQLTTSSARIRDILTVDGGVERLVCLLKAGRSKDPMDRWKWNLAFQCVVNVGVRGSENVRTRVVEADIVPVIATILDNYIKVMDRYREKAEEAIHAQEKKLNGSQSNDQHKLQKDASFGNRSVQSTSEFRTSRRQPPPSIDIPVTFANAHITGANATDNISSLPQASLTSPTERASTMANRNQHNYRAREFRQSFLPPSRHNIQPLAAVPSIDTTDGFSIRPVRDVDRLPSMTLGFHSSLASQPESPMTPLPPIARPSLRATPDARPQRSPSLQLQVSNVMEPTSTTLNTNESIQTSLVSRVSIQSPVNVDIQDISMDEGDSILTSADSALGMATPPTASETQHANNFEIAHQSALEDRIMNDATTPTGPALVLSPSIPTTINHQQTISNTVLSRHMFDRSMDCHELASMPRDEDVLMSLQLLAYVSKYCNLRSYFQKSHLVPKLKVGPELKQLDMDNANSSFPSNQANSSIIADEQEEEEYLIPEDFNIFPLVEKFTIRHHSHDMQYWAGVVMRNLCRKDDSRGGIRQCAHYQCGKWEQFTRQFAKCRRCRRTKYCSKECQKSAWIFHRHWCVAANS